MHLLYLLIIEHHFYNRVHTLLILHLKDEGLTEFFRSRVDEVPMLLQKRADEIFVLLGLF